MMLCWLCHVMSCIVLFCPCGKMLYILFLFCLFV